MRRGVCAARLLLAKAAVRRAVQNDRYAGGLPVAGSEEECLHLMAFAAERGLRLGADHRSADNKNTGQAHQQNLPFLQDAELARRLPWLASTRRDFFRKSAKAFGQDAAPVAAWLREGGVAASIDESIPLVEFPLGRRLCRARRLPSCRACPKLETRWSPKKAPAPMRPLHRVRELKVERNPYLAPPWFLHPELGEPSIALPPPCACRTCKARPGVPGRALPLAAVAEVPSRRRRGV